MTTQERLAILSIWVDPLTMDQALERVSGFVEHGNRAHAIFAANPEKNFSVPQDEILYGIFKNADLIIPDGIGVVLAARLLYGAKIGRVPGVELMERICRLSAEKGFRIFLFGSREEVNCEAELVLKERYPGLIVAGRSSGFVTDEQMPKLIQTINESRADILFIGLGSPRQEKWYASYRDELTTVKVCQGIGGTLDAVTGHVKRAPELWCRLNAEWLYRLVKEPSRLKRQKVLPLFAASVLRAKLLKVLGFKSEQGSVGAPKTMSTGKVVS
jgi:N-acetylglucosaminyldiphosphoundecaprenol N-acetyl-beta-D-mannosaminyltransferase